MAIFKTEKQIADLYAAAWIMRSEWPSREAIIEFLDAK